MGSSATKYVWYLAATSLAYPLLSTRVARTKEPSANFTPPELRFCAGADWPLYHTESGSNFCTSAALTTVPSCATAAAGAVMVPNNTTAAAAKILIPCQRIVDASSDFLLRPEY